MNEKKQKKINMLTMALGIAFMPPIWAVLSALCGIKVGAVALIVAGLFAANGNRRDNALRILLAFIAGDIWAVIAIWIMDKLPLNPSVELYITLFVMGGVAVIIGETASKWLFTPAWLCGWAIGLTIMGPLGIEDMGTMPLQIGIAMVAGVLYVGLGVDAFQKWLIRKCSARSQSSRQ